MTFFLIFFLPFLWGWGGGGEEVTLKAHRMTGMHFSLFIVCFHARIYQSSAKLLSLNSLSGAKLFSMSAHIKRTLIRDLTPYPRNGEQRMSVTRHFIPNRNLLSRQCFLERHGGKRMPSSAKKTKKGPSGGNDTDHVSVIILSFSGK